MVRSLAQGEGFRSELATMNMTVHRLLEPQLITSDSPVVVYAVKGKHQVEFGPGLRAPGTKVIFPVDPATYLQFYRGPRPNTLSPEILNTIIAFHAERYVYSPKRTSEVRRLVKAASVTVGHSRINTENLRQVIDELEGGGDTRL